MVANNIDRIAIASSFSHRILAVHRNNGFAAISDIRTAHEDLFVRAGRVVNFGLYATVTFQAGDHCNGKTAEADQKSFHLKKKQIFSKLKKNFFLNGYSRYHSRAYAM